MMVNKGLDFIMNTTLKENLKKSITLDNDHTIDSHFMTSLENIFPQSDLTPIMAGMKNLNFSNENDTLSFLLTLLNGSTHTDDASHSTHPCDIGFRDGYQVVHGYLALVVCLLGSMSNIVNIMVLTKREMLNSTNTILTGLAIADLLVLLEYSSFAMMYITSAYKSKSYAIAVYILFHAHFSQVTHTVAICLTVTLAVWRYIAICKPHHNLVLCTLNRSRIAIFMAYGLSPILSIPNYLMLTINSTNSTTSGNVLYWVDFTEGAKNGILQSVHFWLHGVLVKLLPCLLLTVLIYHIIDAMYNAKKRKANLMQMRTPSVDRERRIPRMERLTEKTTRMLLTVLLLFLLTELPQGILSFLSGIYGHDFFRECYLHWGDFMDLLALLNSAVNFFLYYSMSHQFRVALRHMLWHSPPPNLSSKPPGITVSTQL